MEAFGIGRVRDLNGMRFGRLVAIKRVENDKYNKARWLCECDCGNKHIANSNNLTRLQTKSCGCLGKYRNGGNNFVKDDYKFNKHEIFNEVVIAYDSGNKAFLLDYQDFIKYEINKYKWLVDTRGYVVCKEFKSGMHRLIMDLEKKDKDKIVDHIHNERRWDNRRRNLRIVTEQQNVINSRTRKSNTSGHVGVYWREDRDCWVAKIKINRKGIYLGSSKDFDEAVKIRKEAEIKYFGEYRYDKEKLLDEDEKDDIIQLLIHKKII